MIVENLIWTVEKHVDIAQLWRKIKQVEITLYTKLIEFVLILPKENTN